jgi:hypothetical protein
LPCFHESEQSKRLSFAESNILWKNILHTPNKFRMQKNDWFYEQILIIFLLNKSRLFSPIFKTFQKTKTLCFTGKSGESPDGGYV